MSLYVQVPIQQIADGLTAIGWSSAGGGGDASLTYSATAPATPINGTLWWDTTNTLLKIYTGGVWTTVNVSAETIASISTSVSQAQSAATNASNSATQALAAKNAITGMQVATGAAGSSVTWNGTTLTVPQGLQGIQGLKGDSGATASDVGLGSVDNTSDADKPISTATQTALNTKANLSSNTYTAPQRTNTSTSTSAIDFRIANNFTINATAANITVTSLTGCIGQSGVIVIENAQNVTGWGAEFNFKTVPTSMSGMEVFSYFVQTETVIRIGRVS